MSELENERRRLNPRRSIIGNALDYLNKLYDDNSNQDYINLDFMQLGDIKALVDVLISFPKLRQLSLHGNRIKELSFQLEKLERLEEIDISNNPIVDIKQLRLCLQGMGSLKRLIASFKGADEDFLKQGLPHLQFYNNSKIDREKKIIQVKRTNKYEVNSEQKEKISNMFDEIRAIYRKTYNNNNDKGNKMQFNEDTKQILSKMYSNIEDNKNAPDSTLSAIYLNGKYAMYKIIETKLLNLVTDNEPEYGKLLSELFDDYDVIISCLSEVAFSKMTGPILPASKNSKQNQLQALEKELVRVRRENEELILEISSLEIDNQNYIRTLYQASKGEKITKGPPRPRARDHQSSPKAEPPKTERTKTKPGTSAENRNHIETSNAKKLTLHQLKETINEISISKTKQDRKSQASRNAKQTMYEHIFTYFLKKFGLKSLAIESATSLITGIQSYSHSDNDVAVFGKVLKNQCGQEFREDQENAKDAVAHLLKQQIKSRSKFKSEAEINQILSEKMNGNITSDEAEVIISYIENHDEALETMEQLQNMYEVIEPKPLKQRKQRQARQQIPDENKKVIKYSLLLNKILDKRFRKHEEYINPLTRAFHTVDADGDGVINEKQFTGLLLNMYPQAQKDIVNFLNIIDPYQTDKITYSDVVSLFSNYPQGNSILSQYKEVSPS